MRGQELAVFLAGTCTLRKGLDSLGPGKVNRPAMRKCKSRNLHLRIGRHQDYRSLHPTQNQLAQGDQGQLQSRICTWLPGQSRED